MIVDSSALIAILKAEDDAVLFKDALLRADRPAISAPTRVETSIVVDRWKDNKRSGELNALFDDFGIKTIAFTSEMVESARAAFQRYGKGMGHPARLNFGDCMAYAAAKATGQPLLFKGNDFSQTDIEPALKRG